MINENLKSYNFAYIDNIPYFEVKGFKYFCFTLKNKDIFGVCLHKSLISKGDLKLLNNKCKGVAKIKSDNAALKNDLLLIEVLDYHDVIKKLELISETLVSLGYHERNNCIVCGNSCEHKNYKNLLLPIDSKCISTLNNDNASNKKNHEKYFKISLVYAIVGAFIGILPAVLMTFLIQTYSIITALLLFLSPFLSILMFYKKPIIRNKKYDLICAGTSLIFIIIYHIFAILYYLKVFEVNSFASYFNEVKIYLLETIIETIFSFIIGYFSIGFLIRKRAFERLKSIK